MTKWVYSFGGGKAEGASAMKNLLGGKGANLAEMANLGLPVPPGFTISTELCTYFYAHGSQLSCQTSPNRSRRRSPISASLPDTHSAIRTIPCWFRCARAPGPRCRA